MSKKVVYFICNNKNINGHVSNLVLDKVKEIPNEEIHKSIENKIENPQLDCGNYVHGTCFIEFINEELNNNRFPIMCLICKRNKRRSAYLLC